MNCQEFINQADAYSQERLDPVRTLAWEEHADCCPSCGIWAAVLIRPALPSAEDPAALTGSILGRTSGPACGQAREGLCDFVDGALPPAELELLAEHLSHCPPCATLAAELGEIEALLPGRAALDPGETFTRGVLEHTSRATFPEPPAHAFRTGWRELLARRPRLALEAAYAATVLIVLLGWGPLQVSRWPGGRWPVQAVRAAAGWVGRLAPAGQAGWQAVSGFAAGSVSTVFDSLAEGPGQASAGAIRSGLTAVLGTAKETGAWGRQTIRATAVQAGRLRQSAIAGVRDRLNRLSGWIEGKQKRPSREMAGIQSSGGNHG